MDKDRVALLAEKNKNQSLQRELKAVKEDLVRAKERIKGLMQERSTNQEINTDLMLKLSIAQTECEKLEEETRTLEEQKVGLRSRLKALAIDGAESANNTPGTMTISQWGGSVAPSTGRGSEKSAAQVASKLAGLEAENQRLREEVANAHLEVEKVNKETKKKLRDATRNTEQLYTEGIDIIDKNKTDKERLNAAVEAAEQEAAETLELYQQTKAEVEAQEKQISQLQQQQQECQELLVEEQHKYEELELAYAETVQEVKMLEEQDEERLLELRSVKADLRYLRSRGSMPTNKKPNLSINAAFAIQVDPDECPAGPTLGTVSATG